ncbi:MAG: endonuclease Q family protein [Candidatus Uhrbacteria bacterium]|nr:endonuclease Q family protein [Patescibacteria group bacterium]MBU1906550.1 endonuclease Q family protein [Patescibacteria group bacterium]
MRFIADWHIHSGYSRACSKALTLPNIAKMCERKGINIVAAPDWTHPAVFSDIENLLVEDRPGMYRLKDGSSPTWFMMSTEVSQIYKKGGRCRRIHNNILSPSIETSRKINQELERREFNLKSDGRPILGIDSEELYKIIKDIDERVIMIPAHAWTPWYSIFGSMSGFDSIEECFGSMTEYIYAVETGLSSDPRMNWHLSGLDKVVLVSNSDAHSLPKLGREANVFEIEEPSFSEFVRIFKEQDKEKFLYTIEFYPEEGMYHADGCRKCGFWCEPTETKKLGGICPKCKKPMVIGVWNRVIEIADRKFDELPTDRIPFKSIVPLDVILAEANNVKSTSSKKVIEQYDRLIDELGSEFDILLEIPISEIKRFDERVAEAIDRMRSGNIHIRPGYDGVYGEVSIWSDAERPKSPEQKQLI